jgi:FG-GAP repeat
MRPILSFIPSDSIPYRMRLRMQVIGLLGLLVATAAILASSGKAPIASTSAPPMPGLRGEAATEYLKQQGLHSSLREAVKAARYAVYPSSPREGEKRGESFYANNPEQRWRAGFTSDGLTLRAEPAHDAGWELGMKLRSAGYGERQLAVREGRLSAKGARIENERAVGSAEWGIKSGQESCEASSILDPQSLIPYLRSSILDPRLSIVEWYVNKAEGLEQGFTLTAPLAERVGEEPLVLRLEMTSNLQARVEADGQSVTFLRKSGARALTYDHLAVVDAQGRNLLAHLEAAGSEVRIVVDDRNASYPVTIDPTFSEIKKLTASDGANGDLFGSSVAIYDDTAIVGAPRDSIGINSLQGSVYIFQRNQDGTDQWGEVKKLIASDGAAFESFGNSVAIYEDTAIVGAPDDSIGSIFSHGSAYVFERNQGGPNNWGEVKKLTASDAAGFDHFGGSVAIYGDTTIIGNPNDDIGSISNQGSAYVFERNQGGPNNWGEVKKLTASDGAELDNFGLSVAIYGDTAIIGAPLDDIVSFEQGSAYVFERNQGGPNNWGVVKKLTALDGALFDRFGSVAIYGDTAIIGAPNDSIGIISSQGSAYVFERNQGGPNNWGEVKKLTASNGAGGELFGFSVAIYGDTTIVGTSRASFSGVRTPGSAYVFGRNQGGANNWGEVQILTPSERAELDFFGTSVAIYENTAIIGASSDPFLTVSPGAAYIFSAGGSPATISAAPVTRAEGDPTTISTIAMVSDPDQAADTLVVTVNGSVSATVNGVTVSNITVDASGGVKADVATACGASNADFTLRVTDNENLFAEATLNVVVTPEEIAPTLTLRPSTRLWPPNHNYHIVTIAQMVESVSDNCSSLSLNDVMIEQVTSDEPDNDVGDGNTTNDIVIASDCRAVQLRAERDGTSDGRVYTITLRLRDNRGNVTRQNFEVSVPINQSGVPSVKGAAAFTVTSGCHE